MKLKVLYTILISVMSLAVQAGTLTVVDLPATGTDAAIGISTAKTYTHTLDFGIKTSGAVTINGVAFDQGSTANITAAYTATSRWGFAYTIADTRATTDIRIHAGNSTTLGSDGQSALLLTDMIYHSSSNTVGQGLAVTLKGLTPGTTYSTRIYYRQWQAVADLRTITVQADGGSNGVFNDTLNVEWDAGGAHYIEYFFVSDDTDVTLKFLTNDIPPATGSAGNGVHLYGLTNELGYSSKAWNPNPANGQGLAASGPLSVGAPLNSVLSWSAPNAPNVDPAYPVQYALYMDPNQTKVNTGTGCLYTRAMNPAVSFDPTPDMTLDTQYYWRVDTQVKFLSDPNIHTLQGSIWTFSAARTIPTIVTQPTDVTIDKGQTAAFTIQVSSYSAETYTWYKTTDNVNNTPADDTGVGYASTLTFANENGANEWYYYCKVVNGATPPDNTIYSKVVKLIVKRQVAHWKLDNAAYTGGLCEDFSGEGHHADPNGTPVFVAGVKDNAITCNASNGFANAGTWNPSNISGQLTAACWVKWNGSAGNQVILSKANHWTGTTLMWELFCGSAGDIYFIGGPTLPAGTLKANEWQFVAVSFNGTTATLYSLPTSSTSVNFVTASAGFTLGAGVNSIVWIGARGDNGTTNPVEQFTGLIDEVQFFNYAKDAKSLADLYNEIYPAKRFCLNTYASQYDYDNNCVLDLSDFAKIAAKWLTCGLYPTSTCQ